MKIISYDNYLRLVGLLALAVDHRKALADIERSACAITGDTTGGSHTSDEVWGGYGRGIAGLLDVLEITVEAPPRPTTTPEDAARQAEGSTLEQALHNLITEARGEDGVGRSVPAAMEAAERARTLLGALERILAELNDDGITEAALRALEEAFEG